jgi:hypothetical protein
MSKVALITLVLQGESPKEKIRTFSSPQQIKRAIDFAQQRVDEEVLEGNTEAKAHLTLHPADYSDQSVELKKDVFITLLPGAQIFDVAAGEQYLKCNVADLTAFACRELPGDWTFTGEDVPLGTPTLTVNGESLFDGDVEITGNISASNVGGGFVGTTDDIAEGSNNLFFTDERAQDAIFPAIVNGTGLTATYDDAFDQYQISVDTTALGIPNDTDDLPEGANNLYFTDARAIAAVTGGVTTDDLVEGATNLFFTEERAQDAVFPNIVGGTDINVTYDDTGNSLTIDYGGSAGPLQHVQNTDLGTTNQTFGINIDEAAYVLLKENGGNLEIRDEGDTTFRNLTADRVFATKFTETSTIELKKNVVPVGPEAMTITKDLRAVTFDWKDTGENDIGLIAEEVEKVCPHLVEDLPRDMKGVNYTKLSVILLRSLQETIGRLEKAESEIEKLSKEK